MHAHIYIMSKMRWLGIMALLVFTAIGVDAQDVLALQRRSMHGEAKATYELGECYYYGIGGATQNLTKAIDCYKEAAHYKYAPAMRDLGYCYLTGTGVKKDNKKAWDWFFKAARRGDASARYMMSQMCKEGLRWKPNPKSYMRNLRKAAELGDDEALNELGRMYMYGDEKYGVKADHRKGVEMVFRAADKGNADALYFMGKNYAQGTNGIAENQQKAFECYQRCVKAGNTDAYYDLGMCYLTGQGTKQNLNEAYRQLDLADRQNVPEAARALGDMYRDGLEVSRNAELALKYYEKAAGRGDKLANVRIADMYFEGDGVNHDPEKAFRMYSEAINDNIAEAYAGMGDCYLSGEGAPKNASKAQTCFNRAADNGCIRAFAQLGNMYYTGTENIERNYVTAMKYYRHFLQDPQSVPRGIRGNTYRKLAACYRFGRGVEEDQTKAADYTRMAYESGVESLKSVLE